MDRPINIVLVSLNNKFCKTVAAELAQRLEMFYADCHDMLVYDLTNPKEVLTKCGIEYFKKRERAVVRNCSEYENTVLSITFDLYKPYKDLFVNSLVVYIRLPQGKQDAVVNKINYGNRDIALSQDCQIVVDIEQKSIKKCTDLIINKMGEIYESC